MDLILIVGYGREEFIIDADKSGELRIFDVML
jgi:hypothetical protein